MDRHQHGRRSSFQSSRLRLISEDKIGWDTGVREPEAAPMTRIDSVRSSTSSGSQWSAATIISSSSPSTANDTGYDNSYPKYSEAPPNHIANMYDGNPSTTAQSYYESTLSSKPTPKSLGWLPDTQLWRLYTVVISDKKVLYLELLPDLRLTSQTPIRVYLDPPSKDSNGYHCQFPGGCFGKQAVFKRLADLTRHYIHVHASPKDKFFCSYQKCGRSKDPFTRKDHYRDHLRDFHKENISGKHFKTTEAEKKWLSERKNKAGWWRCPKCLQKVQFPAFQCQVCNNSCETYRRTARERLREEASAMSGSNQSVASMTDYTPHTCAICNDTAWLQSGNDLVPCPSCQPSQTVFFYDDANGSCDGDDYHINT